MCYRMMNRANKNLIHAAHLTSLGTSVGGEKDRVSSFAGMNECFLTVSKWFILTISSYIPFGSFPVENQGIKQH